MTRQCQSCGRFVRNSQLATIWHSYAIDFSKPVAVYSLATAVKLNERLDCNSCSMRDFLLIEAARDHGVAVGRGLPGGWERCDPQATQSDYDNREAS